MTVNQMLKSQGVQVRHDNSVKTESGRTTQDLFRRLINAARAAETSFRDQLDEANESCRIAQDEAKQLIAENAKLKAEVLRLRLKQGLEEKGVSIADREELLAIASKVD